MPNFQNTINASEIDDAYISLMSKPTNDEVGADIETYGHVTVTPENITQDPFTQKGSLSNALDDLIEAQGEIQNQATIDNPPDSGDQVIHLPNLHDKSATELTEANADADEKMVGEDEGDSAKSVLSSVFDEMFAMDGTGDNQDEDDEEELIYKDWEKKTWTVPDLPTTLDDKDKPDANGLVYITRTFTVDPEKYLSTNYRPIAAPKKNLIQQKTVGGDIVTKEEVTMEEESSPDAKFSAASDDEPSDRQEQEAAKEADKIDIPVKDEAPAKDTNDKSVSYDHSVGRWVAFPNARMSGRVREIVGEPQDDGDGRVLCPCHSHDLNDDSRFSTLIFDLARVPSFSTKEEAESYLKEVEGKRVKEFTKQVEDESVVLDYATYIDGSSFCCCDEVSGIDYSKIALDAGPKKKVTRENCETTFAQCRAKNPLFCRFHGPKLLEADIKTAIRSVVGAGVFVNVTKDKDAKDKFTFRLTVGCTPAQKPMVEKQIHEYMTNNPGIKSKEDWKDVGKHKQSQEFEMDILRADKPPMRGDNKETQAVANTKRAIKADKMMAQVETTPEAIENKAAKNIKPANFAPELANEWLDIDRNFLTITDLPENKEFQKEYEKIEADYNKAYDAEDKESLKKAIRDLKDLIREYKPHFDIPQGPSDEPPEAEEGEMTEQKTEAETESAHEQVAAVSQQPPQPQQNTEVVESEEEPKVLKLHKPKGSNQESEQGDVGEGINGEGEVNEPEPMGLLNENEPPENDEAQSQINTNSGKRKHNPYSYAAYGDQPNDDDLNPGGSGDIVGAELLQYVKDKGHLLNLPKNWGKYSAALSRWNRALKTGGLYHGKAPTKANRPTMNQFGISDPIADWINDTLDGGLRKGDRGTFISLFGFKPKEGSNDSALDDLPPEAQGLYEKGGPVAIAEAFLKAKENYSQWVDSAKEAARKRKEASGKKRFDDDDIISLDYIESKDSADKEYNEAFAEVERFGADSPEIQNLSREQMESLKEGDKIRFDHSDAEFIVNGYDADNDILTVFGFDGEEKYHIGPEGIEKVDNETIDSNNQVNQKGTETNGQETENGTTETVAGNEESTTSGGQDEQGKETAGKPDDAQIDNAASAISASLNGISVDSIRDGLESIIDGTSKVDPDVKDLVDKALPKGDPVRDAIDDRASRDSDGFALESVSQEDLNREKRRNEERKEVKRRLNADLHGSAGEVNQSLFDLDGLEGEDLFNRIQDTTETILKGNPSQEIKDISERATEAVEEVRSNEAISAELDSFLDELDAAFDRASSTVIGAAIEDAIDTADENAEAATETARDEMEALQEASEKAFRRAEKTSKGNSAAKVEKSLTDLAKAVFTDDSKTDNIGQEAQNVGDSVLAYAKEKGVDRELDSSVSDVIEDLKKDSERLEGLMGDYQRAMQATGTDFQDEDIGYISGSIGRLSTDIANKFDLLRTMEKVERKRIDEAVELKKQKESLKKSISEESKDAPESGESKETDENERPETAQKEVVKPSQKAPSEKPKARDSGDAELRKEVIAASRRLGLDAYKPDKELNKMLRTAKEHISDPRQAQRVKDIEAILADRKVKGKREVTEAEKEAAKAEL